MPSSETTLPDAQKLSRIAALVRLHNSDPWDGKAIADELERMGESGQTVLYSRLLVARISEILATPEPRA